jgi:hypothetical protein
MADRENGDRGPLEIIGALVAIGAIGGSRGQLALSRLKRLAAWSAGFCLLMAPATLLIAFPYAAIWLGIACLGALLSCALWCYAALAKWLTSSETDR